MSKHCAECRYRKHPLKMSSLSIVTDAKAQHGVNRKKSLESIQK